MNEWKRSLLTGTIVALGVPALLERICIRLPDLPCCDPSPDPPYDHRKKHLHDPDHSDNGGGGIPFPPLSGSQRPLLSPETAGQLATNSIFYLCYGLLFSVLVPSKPTVSYRRLFPSVFICDLLSNLLEVCIFEAAARDSFLLHAGI